MKHFCVSVLNFGPDWNISKMNPDYFDHAFNFPLLPLWGCMLHTLMWIVIMLPLQVKMFPYPVKYLNMYWVNWYQMMHRHPRYSDDEFLITLLLLCCAVLCSIRFTRAHNTSSLPSCQIRQLCLSFEHLSYSFRVSFAHEGLCSPVSNTI